MEPNELPDNLPNIRHLHTYTVPSDYFDGLADEIISKVHIPLIAELPFAQPPINYFDDLADSVLSKIKANTLHSDSQKELEEIDPFLASVPRTNVYRVPQGYFESFTVPVSSLQQVSPVIKMHRKASWLRYASAAVVTGIIATGIVFFIKERTPGDNQKYTQALAKVSDNELVNYLDNTSVDADMTTPEDYSNFGSSEGLYKSLLDDVSDNEIQDYLNENDDSNEKNIKGI